MPIYTLLYFWTALLLAKGKSLGQVFGLLIVILYSIVSFKNKFYGEVIIYLLIMLPMYIIGIISWIKHQNKETNSVEVNKIAKKEWVIVAFISIVCFIGIYLTLKSFNTNQLFISSLSVLDSLFAIYLQIRRSKYSFYFYVVNDLISKEKHKMIIWCLKENYPSGVLNVPSFGAGTANVEFEISTVQ